jgi:hypothetical protein
LRPNRCGLIGNFGLARRQQFPETPAVQRLVRPAIQQLFRRRIRRKRKYESQRQTNPTIQHGTTPPVRQSSRQSLQIRNNRVSSGSLPELFIVDPVMLR